MEEIAVTFKCVLFDLDNTLLQKKPTIVEKVFEFAHQYYPKLCVETIEKAYAASELWQGQQLKKENETGQRMNDEEYFRNVLSVYLSFLPANLPTELDNSEMITILSRNYGGSYTLIPNAIAVLEYLKRKDLILGIVSNNHTKIRQPLIDFRIDRYFDCIVLSEEVNLYKPDPKIMELACKKLKVPCKNSIYIGNHPFDVLCAHSANMSVAWFPPNRFFTVPKYIDVPEYTIHALTDLIGIL